jgi:hypothetical protein
VRPVADRGSISRPIADAGLPGVTSHVVRASASEAYGIWHRWSHVYGVQIQQEIATLRRIVGHVAEHPVEVRVTWYVIADHRIAFIDPISDVVDRPMIDAWARRSFFPDLADQDAEARIADATDFQIVLAQIFREKGKRIPMRDLVALDRAIASVRVQEEDL